MIGKSFDSFSFITSLTKIVYCNSKAPPLAIASPWGLNKGNRSLPYNLSLRATQVNMVS